MTNACKKLGVLAMLLCAAMLAGCVSLPFTPTDENARVEMPSPAPSEYVAPTGDGRADRNVRVTLYFVSSGRQQLASVVRTVRVGADEDVLRKTLERLLEAPGASGLTAVAPEGTRVLSVENNGKGVVTVDLSAEALKANAQDLVWMRAAVTMTLTEFEDVDAVNVLIGGQEESALTLPTGAMTRPDIGLTALWAQLQADEDRMALTGDARKVDRFVTLYFASRHNSLLLCETRSVRFTSSDFVTPVIEALQTGPSAAVDSAKVLPSDAAFLRENGASVVASEDGLRLIELHAREDLLQALSAQNLDYDAMCASLAYTLCRFVPEADGVTLYAGDMLLTERPITPDELGGRAGRLATVYFSNAQGGLTASRRVLDQIGAVSPRVLLEALIEGPGAYGEGLSAVFPKGVTAADLLAVRVEEGTALVNLSSNFYRCSQSMTQREERNLIYAIVNTLTTLEDVTQVRFYIDGETLDTLVGFVYLRGALMRNPGIIS